MDYPGCIFWEKFLEWNPDAKVILSVRDSPEAWAVSARNTIFAVPEGRIEAAKKWIFKNCVAPLVSRIRHMHYIFGIFNRAHGVQPTDPNTDLAKMYEDWNASVIAKVPSEKLLIFNVKEGWEPLCEFLGVAVPEQEFPRTNSTEQFQERRVNLLKALICG